ncbi:MAG: hypothetical protein ABW185_28625 [Sedimenticola sp.]
MAAKPTKAVGKKTQPKACKEVVNIASFTEEISSILKQMNDSQQKLSEKVDNMSGRVNSLYDYIPYDEYYEEENTPSQFQLDETSSPVDIVSEEQFEPPTKCAKISGETTGVFSSLLGKYKQSELLDNEIDDELAEFVNKSFRGGLSEETYNNFTKEIHRPVNCTGLVKTRVNQQMWGYLKPSTQTFDARMQNVQEAIVKATSNLCKLLDKGSHCEDKGFDSQMVEWGTDAIGILGYAHKLVNLRRKECHKSDLDRKYHHLTSASVPFTDQLYGDDVCKNVKEIQDISKISRQLSVVSRYPRGGRRSTGRMWAAGRGRARGRGGHYGRQWQSYGRQWQPPASKNMQAGPSRK